MKPHHAFISTLAVVLFLYKRCNSQLDPNSTAVVPTPDIVSSPPPSQPLSVRLADELSKNGEFSIISALIQSQNISSIIDQSGGSITLLAPTDYAFSLVPTVDLIKINSTGSIPALLLYHFLIGYYNYSSLHNLPNGTIVPTLSGFSVPIYFGDGRILIDPTTYSFQVSPGVVISNLPAVLTQPDVFQDGAVLAIEGIDKVLIPSAVYNTSSDLSEISASDGSVNDTQPLVPTLSSSAIADNSTISPGSNLSGSRLAALQLGLLLPAVLLLLAM